LTTAKLAHGILTVVGTPRADVLSVVKSGADLKVSGVPGAFQTRAVHKIVVYAGAGNDRVAIDPRLAIPAYVNAGAGNDRVLGGGGNGPRVGGPGRNTLDGRGGRDTVNGVREPVNSGPGLGLIDGLSGCEIQWTPAQKAAGDRLAADYNDIRQGDSFTCFFGAALSAVARSGVDLASRIHY